MSASRSAPPRVAKPQLTGAGTLLKHAINPGGPTRIARLQGGLPQMRDVFVCDAVRTPIGRFGGSLAKVRADDLPPFRSRR